jgi:hypothetical protein
MADDAAPLASTSAPASAPAAEVPSTTPSTSISDLDKLAQPTDVSEYAAQRQDDAKPPADRAEQTRKRLSHHERMKRVMDAARVEANELRTAQTPPQQQQQGEPDNIGDEQARAERDGAADAETRTPEEAAALRDEVGQHALKEIEARAIYRERERMYAAQVPDYKETLALFDHVDIGDHTAALLRESSYGPVIVYALAKHALSNSEDRDLLYKLKEMNEKQVMQFIAQSEARLELAARQSRTPPPQQGRRMTQAPRPMTQYRGSGGPPPRLADLAASDDITNYAEHRAHMVKRR